MGIFSKLRSSEVRKLTGNKYLIINYECSEFDVRDTL